MHIAINLRLFIKGEIGGLENYVRHVVRGIAEHQRRHDQPLTVFARRSEVENVRQLAPDARLLVVPHSIAEACTAAEIQTGDYDVLFCPLLILEPESASIPSAVMVPDLLHEYHPEFFSEEILAWRHRHYPPTLERASVLFTLSSDSRSTIVERFDVAPEKVEVIHLDVDPEFRGMPSDASRAAFRRLGLPPRYVYYPANYWPHKNHETLLRAMRLLAERHPDLHLVLTGASSTGEERVRQSIAELGLAKRVRILGYQDVSVLPEIYRNARMMVFPSLFEGFGIPVLEAYHCGVPAVVADSGSCPEIAGDAAVLVDASDAEAIAAAIERLLEDESLRRNLIEKGRRRAAEFSWQRAVEQTLRTLDRLGAAAPSRPAGQLRVRDHPVVSIVTPSFNMAKYIGETIDSVLAQDYPHIDYNVVDGGSTDGTLEILRGYGGRIRYRSEPDGGQGDAVNKGFRESRGRVFTFLNADDTYLPGAVGKAVRRMVENPGAGVVYGEGLHVLEDGTAWGRYPTQPFSADTFARNCYICQPAAFMWADVFEAAGMIDPGVIALDYDLWIRIHRLGIPLLKIDEELATSRMYPDNKTLRQRGDVYRDIIGIVRRHYGYVPYDWLFGYACYLVDRKDQFFEPTSSSRLKALVALALGLRHNPRHPWRYAGEWAGHVGLAPRRGGRWEDGWISRHFAQEFAVADSCRAVRIAGRHVAPLPQLDLTVRLGGELLGRERLRESGPFVIEYACPRALRGGAHLLEIDCSGSFQPRRDGDRRHLSCIVDAIEFVADAD